jgi:pyridoxine 5'-phosphate synthase PdxJ
LYVKDDTLQVCNLSDHEVTLLPEKGEKINGKHELKLCAGQKVELKGAKKNWIVC